MEIYKCLPLTQKTYITKPISDHLPSLKKISNWLLYRSKSAIFKRLAQRYSVSKMKYFIDQFRKSKNYKSNF
jgi:hypothetical protein